MMNIKKYLFMTMHKDNLMSSERRQLQLILWVMLTISIIVTLIVTTNLYRTALNQQRLHLIEIVHSGVRLMEAVTEVNAEYSHDYPEGYEAATISRIRKAHSSFKSFGESGQYTLARLAGGQVEYILQHRNHKLLIPESVSLQTNYAQTMRRALNGESGTMIGLNYSGQQVLAAYEPVGILNLGLVAKINLAEIRQPFIRSGLLALVTALIFILIGIRIISKLSQPIIKRLEEHAAHLQETIKTRTDDWQSRAQLLHKILEVAPDAIVIVDNEYKIIETNPLLDKLFGYDPDELIGKELEVLMPHQFRKMHAEYQKDYFSKQKLRPMNTGLNLAGLKKDGSQFPVDISLNPIKTDSGKLVFASVRDITDSKKKIERLQGAVQDAEEKTLMMYKVFMDTADPIIIEDLDGNIIDLNTEAELAYNFTRDELLGLPMTTLVPPERHTQSNDHLQRCKTGENLRNIESLRWDREHKTMPVLLTFSQLKNDSGQTIGAATIAKDITEQKNIEAELEKERQRLEEHVKERTKDLRESQQLLSAIIENSGAVIYLKDLEGRYQLVNKQWETFVGIKREDAIGKLDKDFCPDDADAIRGNDNDVLEKKTLLSKEEVVTAGDGSIHTFLSFKFPMYGQDGCCNGLCGISTDITDQKILQQDIYELNRNFIALLENTPDFLYIKDKDYKYIAASQSFAKLIGYKSWRELIGKDDFEVLSKKNANKFYYEELGIMQYGDEILETEQQYLAKDFKTHWISTKKLPLRDENENIIGLFSVSRDITELKQTAVQLENAKQVAEAATSAKSNFLASMSHEIRTPMNAIIGMVSILQQSNIGAEQNHMLNTISDSSQSLLTIINDILDFSKIEAGKLDLEAIPTSLTDAVEGSARILLPNLKKKNLRLLTYVDPELPHFVIGDPVRISQILINFVNNAIKFSEKGNIEIRAEQLRKIDSNKIFVQFRVIDEGIGIPDDMQQLLFDPFTQAETSTTRKYGGTGLGLAICSRLTEMMNGEIGVNSKPGKGSEFFVRLEFQPSEERKNLDKTRDLSGLRILLIVDNEKERDNYISYLEYWHAEVFTEDNMDSGLVLFKSADENTDPFNIVVLGSQLSEEEKSQMRNLISKNKKHITPRFVSLCKGRRHSGGRLQTKNYITLDIDPVTAGRAEFISAVAIVAGRASPEIHNKKEEIKNLKAAYFPTLEEALEQGTLILVAEDNLTNQDVIQRQLNLLGYACEIVDDGKQALEAWHSKDYAMLLTDCHMPDMDGFELTNTIRKAEMGKDKQAIIIAITANALHGEAKRCLAAGMDDYLSKPIDIKKLRNKLKKWMPNFQADIDSNDSKDKRLENSNDARQTNEPVDEKMLKGMLGDDPEVFKEILKDFIKPSRDIIEEMQTGWEQRSAELIKQATHKLKSSARSIGANELADACALLEKAGKEEDWKTIHKNIHQPDKLMTEVESYINKL
jgi:PAS domain S-box-containing protein